MDGPIQPAANARHDPIRRDHGTGRGMEQLIRARRGAEKADMFIASAREINTPFFSPWTDYALDPEGLYRTAMRLAKYGRPIYITENGTHQPNDHKRNQHLVGHLYHLHRAIQDGADVRGYFSFTLVKEWEWILGRSLDLAMFAVDRDTLDRTPSRSPTCSAILPHRTSFRQTISKNTE